MTIRVLVNGASGKMGQQAVAVITEHSKEFLLVATAGSNDVLKDVIKTTKPDVVLDLTRAEAVLANTQTIIENGARPVIGTSGLLPEQVTALTKRCAELKRGGIIAPNFSLGAVLMMKFAKEAAKYFSSAEIIEMHHPQKYDSPSGTAVHTAALIAAERNLEPTLPQTTKETLIGARGALFKNIPIHAIRMPGIIANQEVLFGGLSETLSIKHVTLDRQCFMPGIVYACKKVMELDNLIYGLENLL